MKDRIAKLAKLIEDLNARQEAALAAVDADGISEEDQAKHLAEFDRLQAEKEKVQSQLKRAEQLERDQAAAAAPTRTAVIQEPHAGVHGAGDRLITIPARVRRVSNLRAFNFAASAEENQRNAYLAGLWYAGALFGHQPSRERCRSAGLDFVDGPMATLDGLTNQSGGFFVPEIIETAIIEISQSFGAMRRLAEIVPMSSETQTSPRWSQAMVAYWIGRGEKPTSSDPAWNAVQLIARDLGAMTKISRQLSEDALIDLGEKVTMNIGLAFSYAEDNAGVNGDGTSTYGNIKGLIPRLNEPGNANSVKTATGETTLAALTNASFLSVVGNYPAYPNASPAWICHKSVWAQSIARLQLAGGGNTVESIASGGRPTYLGYPVEWVQTMPKAPASGDIAIIFADLKLGVKVGDRRGRTVQAGFENDDFTKQLVTILGTSRVDINVHTVVDPKGDATVTGGPIMALKLG